MSEVERIARQYGDEDTPIDTSIQSEEEFVDWASRVNEALEQVDDPEDLRFIIDDHLWVQLPVEISNNIFDLYLNISNREPEVLRMYSIHLDAHGPEWQDKAARLVEEAEEAGD